MQLERCRRREPRLVADAMLGRLAKWLRIMGYDTLYDVLWDDPELVRIARRENRVLLTRDRELARRRNVRVQLVDSERIDEQLVQLSRDLGIVFTPSFSRCAICNAELEVIPRDRAWGQVPPYVFVVHTEFRLCPACNRFYWRGSHWKRMQDLIGAGQGRCRVAHC